MPAPLSARGRRDLPLRAHRRRPRRRGRRDAPRSGLADLARLSRRPARHRARRSRRRLAGATVFARARPRRSRARAAAAAAARPAERVRAGRRSTRYARLGADCSTTAAARPTRSAGCCCTSYGCRDATALAAVGRDLHGAAARPTSGRTSASTSRNGRLYVPLDDLRRASASTSKTLLARPRRRRRARLVADEVAWTRALMLRGAPLVHAPARARRLGTAPRRRRAACASSSASSASAARRFGAGRRLGWRDAAGARLARARHAAPRRRRCADGRMTPEQYVQQKAARAARASTTLPVPAAAARAPRSPRFYAFCREVDDVVDEVTDPAVARDQARLVAQRDRARFRRPAAHPVTQALMPHVAALRIEPSTSRRHRRLRDGSRAVALPRLRRRSSATAICVAGVVGEVAASIFGRTAAADARLRASPRPGDAADQHHPRRRRRRAPRPHLPADGRAAAVRRQGARSSSTRAATRPLHAR